MEAYSTGYIRKSALEWHLPGEAGMAERSKITEQWPRDKQASDSPSNLGLVTYAYSDMLAVQAMWSRFRGMAVMFGVVLLIVAGAIFCFALPFFLKVLYACLVKSEWFAFVLGVLVNVGLLFLGYFGVLAFIYTVRVDIMSPLDVPYLFNRKTRKVYAFMLDVPSTNEYLRHPGVLFRPWQMTLIEYDWNCMQAEFMHKTELQGKIVRSVDYLNLFVRKSPDSDEVIGGFLLNQPTIVGREPALSLWECVRRFMEEDGPVLYPGDTAPEPLPTTFFGAATTMTGILWIVALIGLFWTARNILKSGEYEFPIFSYIICFLCSAMMVAVISNWLAHKYNAKRAIPLPPEAMQDAGEPIDLQALADKVNGVHTAKQPKPVSRYERRKEYKRLRREGK